MLGVVGDLSDGLIGRRHVAAEKALGVDYRGCRTQFVPDWKRVFSPARIGMVEIVNPIGDGRVIGDCRGGIGYGAGWIGHSEFLWFVR